MSSIRKTSRLNDRGQAGVTIAELLVVAVVIAVLAGFALMQRGSANEQFKRQNVAQVLKSAFERARFDSVKRRADAPAAQAQVIIDTTTITLRTDRDQNGVLDAADDQVTDLSGQNIVIGGDVALTLPATVSFNQRGEASMVSASLSTDPFFYVCNASCGSPTDANANVVLVTPTGTVNLLPGGSAAPFFPDPVGLSTPLPGDSINNTAVVTPTPTP